MRLRTIRKLTRLNSHRQHGDFCDQHMPVISTGLNGLILYLVWREEDGRRAVQIGHRTLFGIGAVEPFAQYETGSTTIDSEDRALGTPS